VLALDGKEGIRIHGEVADIRPLAHAAALTILPMRCGGGIKNKLLEAAALGRPIVASARAVDGLELPSDHHALRVCGGAASWVRTIDDLWADAAAATVMGACARDWVERNHRWSDVAAGLLDWVYSDLGERATVIEGSSTGTAIKAQAAYVVPRRAA
jgi:glycosyltransferase involved in cell wall biosynthesis